MQGVGFRGQNFPQKKMMDKQNKWIKIVQYKTFIIFELVSHFIPNNFNRDDVIYPR